MRFIGSVIFLVILCGTSVCFTQDDPNNLYLKKGKLIYEENTSASARDIEIVQYRLEQVELVKPLRQRTDEPPLEKAFRITIVTAKPLPFSDYSIWIDSNQKDAYLIKPNSVAVIIYAKTLPSGTITLALSKRNEQSPDPRLILPGTLYVPPDYAAPLDQLEASRPIIRLRRLTGSIRRVEIRIEIPQSGCPNVAYINNPLVLEIDGKNFGIGCDGDNAIVSGFTNEEFAQLRDGAEIALKFASSRGARNRQVIGRLNKNLIPTN